MIVLANYRSYRGRSPFRKFLKALLILVLILILIAAVAFLYLQKYITYSADGIRFNPPFAVQSSPTAEPGQTQPSAAPTIIVASPSPSVSAAQPQEFAQLSGLFLSADLLTSEQKRAAALTQLENLGASSPILDMKQTTGQLSYASSVPAAVAAKTAAEDSGTLAAATELLSGNRYAVARISCFRDNLMARANPALAIHRSGGAVWTDGSGKAWLDPYNPDARQYLADVAVELAQMGFDEILLDDLSFPTTGKLSRIVYDNSENLSTVNCIDNFVTQIKEALAPYNVRLSVLVEQTLPEAKINEKSGQCLSDLLLRADRMYLSARESDLTSLADRISVASLGGADPKTAFVPILSKKPASYEGSWAIG